MNFIRNYFNSLKTRLIFSGIFMVVILLPIVGLTIVNAYQKHMYASIKNELVAYSYSILAVAEVEQGELVMPELLVENLFNTPDSGLYALITAKEETAQILWQSPSLLAEIKADETQSPMVGKGEFYSINIEKNEHFLYSFSVGFDDGEQVNSLTLHIIKQQNDYLVLMNEFHQQLWVGLFILMAVLLIVQLIWLKWSLKPLAMLKKEIASIEKGRERQLKAQYPKELKQVTEQLNTLLTTEQNQRQRYRNSLSDLAHSLKTPLAVLQGYVSNLTQESNLQEMKAQSQEQLDVINKMVEHQLKRAQSAGQSSWHLGVEVSPICKKLVKSLHKIYRDKDINYQIIVDEETIFKGDETDLLEILGNLLDNACKAAIANVQVSVSKQNHSLLIIVEDDGCGIEQDKVNEILQRGTRADTYTQGHGIGLAIVRDLVESYQGTLRIEQSKTLNGAKFVLQFEQ